MIIDNKYKISWKHEPNTKGEWNRSYSTCNIEKKVIQDEIEIVVLYASSTSIVHPKDHFDRKRGVFYSFKNAVSKIASREERTLLWKHYWKTREVKPQTLMLSRDKALLDFLKEHADKKIEGSYIKYKVIRDTELWFKRES